MVLPSQLLPQFLLSPVGTMEAELLSDQPIRKRCLLPLQSESWEISSSILLPAMAIFATVIKLYGILPLVNGEPRHSSGVGAYVVLHRCALAMHLAF